MPYTVNSPNLPSNVKALPAVKKRQWIAVWNSAYAKCISDGGKVADCESGAFAQANGVVKMALDTVNFPSVEIFAVGKWNGHEFSSKDLDAIIQSYKATEGKFDIPIKLGHNDKQKLLDDQPAAGWLTNLRRVGTKLIGDFKNVPATVADLIISGAFRKRSVELNPDFEIDGKTYPLVLTGIALLGSTLPAVDSLADIVKLYEKEEIESEDKAEILIFEVDQSQSFEELMAGLDEWAVQAERFFKGKPGATVLRGLHRAFKERLHQANRGTTRSSKMAIDEEAIRKALKLGEDDDIVAAINKLQEGEEEELPNNNVEVSELKQELSKATARVLTLEGESAKAKAEKSVDGAIANGKLLPVQRDTAMKMALRDRDEFEAFIETQPKVLEFGERGSQHDDAKNNFSRFEPTAIEVETAKSLGAYADPSWRVNLMRTKAKQAGVELPADFK